MDSSEHNQQDQGQRASEKPPRRILVVEDNQDAAEILAALLQAMGHQARTALDGIQALQAAQSYRPDIVLLDISLPRVDGYEVARRIRAEPWGKEMKLIALTGWAQEEHKRRAREAGFDRHLTKPVELADLEKMLAMEDT